MEVRGTDQASIDSLPGVGGFAKNEVIIQRVQRNGYDYSARMTGAKMVFPGPHLDGKSLHELFESEAVTMSAGVPTRDDGHVREVGGMTDSEGVIRDVRSVRVNASAEAVFDVVLKAVKPFLA